jgi:hypothetical protein
MTHRTTIARPTRNVVVRGRVACYGLAQLLRWFFPASKRPYIGAVPLVPED